MFFELAALLYYLGFLLLLGLTLFIACQRSRRTHTRFRLRRVFFLLAISLLIWEFTLFLEPRTTLPAAQFWLGRTNFAAVIFVAYLALCFVREVAATGAIQISPWSRWLLAETGLLAVLTLLTRFVDAAERVEAEHPVTTFGPLFPVYLLHILGYLGAALTLAFRERRQTLDNVVRGQLMLIGLGMLATGGIALVTNALLPYSRNDFRFCDLGTLSTVFFVLAIAYAIFFHRLFDLRLILRETLVYGLLLTFVLGAYSSTAFLITEYLTSSVGKLTQFVVLMIAFMFDPLRRLLEEKVDQLLFGKHGEKGRRKRLSRSRKSSRSVQD